MVDNIKPTDRIVVDLEMMQVDYNEQKKESLRKEISNKYGVPVKNIEINLIPITINKNGQRVSLAADVTNNVQDEKFQKALMKEWLLEKGIEVNFDEIDTIDNQVNSFIDFDQYSKYKNYKFKYVKWSNYLCYGPDNYFDFTNLHGLVLLNSEPANQGGKTTFAIDLLRFALFGKADKSPNLESVFNVYTPDTTEVCVEAGIEIDGDNYVIRRTITRPSVEKRTSKSKCKQKVEYFKNVNDTLEVIENCEGESTQQTNNIIRDSVGNVDDFNLVISATSYTLIDLLKMGQSDKGRLFSRWLGLLSIEKKEEIAKKLWKENYQTKLLSNTYNIETLESEINDYNTCINDERQKCSDESEQLVRTQERINKANDEKTKIITSIKPVQDNLDTIDVTSLRNQLESNNEELVTKRGLFSKLKEEYIEVKDAKYSPEDLEKAQDELNKCNNDIHTINVENAELRTEIGLLRKDVEHIESLINDGICPTCHQQIDLFEQNKAKETNQKRQNTLINKGITNKENIERINARIKEIETYIAELNKQRINSDKKVQLELKLTAVHTNIENLKLMIESKKQTLDAIKTNEANIKYNNEIRIKANLVDVTLAKENEIKEGYIRSIEQHKNDIKQYQSEISTREEIILKLKNEAIMIRNWNVYLDIVGKNGIIKNVLRQALPIINNEVSRILSGLCDFEVRLDIDDKNNVVMNLWRNDTKLDLTYCTSGFEGTMAALALRSALASISTMSKPNFICLDEVLTGVAVSNYENVRELYRRIVNNYDFILNITHNEAITDWHTQNITVTKNDYVSSISFNKNIK